MKNIKWTKAGKFDEGFHSRVYCSIGVDMRVPDEEMDSPSFLLNSFRHSTVPGILKWLEENVDNIEIFYQIHTEILSIDSKAVIHWKVEILDPDAKMQYLMYDIEHNFDENTGELLI